MSEPELPELPTASASRGGDLADEVQRLTKQIEVMQRQYAAVIQEMRGQIAAVNARIRPPTPLRDYFIVDATATDSSGTAAWKEKYVTDAGIVDFNSGREVTDETSDVAAYPLGVNQGIVIAYPTPGGMRYGMIKASTRLYKITAVTGTFPAWSYTAQLIVGYDSSLVGEARWVTDGVNVTGVLNRMEFAPAGGTYPYTYGNGSNITASDGTVDSGSCVIIPIGVGAVVDVTGGWDIDADATIYSFAQANSAEAP